MVSTAELNARVAITALAVAISKMEPAPVYVRRDVMPGTAKAIIAWAKRSGFPTTMGAGDMHTTLVYSKQPLDWFAVAPSYAHGKDRMTVPPGGPRTIEVFGEGEERCAVLRFYSDWLTYRVQQFVDAGYQPKHWPYAAHITITWRVPVDFDVEAITPFQGAIELGPELWERIDLDNRWSPDDVVEKGYNPNQRRAPKGSKDGGQWTKVGEGFAQAFSTGADGGAPDGYGMHDAFEDPKGWSKKPPAHTVEKPGSIQHPFDDDKGLPVFVHRPTKPGDPAAWGSPDAVATVIPGGEVPAELGGVPFTPWGGVADWSKAPGTDPSLEAGMPDLSVGHLRPAAGVIIQEPDGRIWMTRPTNGFGGYQHCVTLDAEILTKRGWLTHEQVEVGDETLGLVNGTLRWTPVLEVVRFADAEVHDFGGEQWSSRCTINHRWATSDRYGDNVKMIEAHERLPASSRDRFVMLSAPLHPLEGGFIHPHDAAIIGWTVCDGQARSVGSGVNGGATHQITIFQKKARGLASLRHLLKDVPHTEHAAGNGGRGFYIHSAYTKSLMARTGWDGSKDAIPALVRSMSRDAASAWLNAAWEAEGLTTDKRGNRVALFQKDGPVFEAMGVAAYLTGRLPMLSGRPGDMRRLSVASPYIGTRGIRMKPAGRAPVWCVRTECGTWTMRQNDAIVLTGNTFPKGSQEKGLTLQQTAVKEAWEETGLQVKLTGVFGDYKRTTSVGRYYLAERVGGDPSKMGWESQALRLVPPDRLHDVVNMKVDHELVDDLLHDLGLARSVKKERSTWLTGASLSALAKATTPPSRLAVFMEAWRQQVTPVMIDPEQAEIDKRIARIEAVTKGWDESKHPRWPPGSPLGGQFKKVGAGGVTEPPSIGSAANPAYGKKAAALYGLATTSPGDLKAVLDVMGLDAKAAAIQAKIKGGKKPNSNDKWWLQLHQYAQQLQSEVSGKATAGAKVAATAQKVAVAQGKGAPLTIDDLKKTGSKPGGSNPGGMYVTASGEKVLVKGSNGGGSAALKEARARNEVLSSKLLEAAGVGAPKMEPVDLKGQYGGGIGVASYMIEGGHAVSPNNAQDVAAARADFAVHAWLANYDAIGTGFDNTRIVDGKAINIDPGGALLFRAQGAEKYPGSNGKMPSEVSEWEGMRNAAVNHYAAAIYGGMTASELKASAQKVAAITPDTIETLVNSYAASTIDKPALIASLIARRADVLKKAGLDLTKPTTVEQPLNVSSTNVAAPAAPTGVAIPAGIAGHEMFESGKKWMTHGGGFDQLDASADMASKWGTEAATELKADPSLIESKVEADYLAEQFNTAIGDGDADKAGDAAYLAGMLAGAAEAKGGAKPEQGFTNPFKDDGNSTFPASAQAMLDAHAKGDIATIQAKLDLQHKNYMASGGGQWPPTPDHGFGKLVELELALKADLEAKSGKKPGGQYGSDRDKDGLIHEANKKDPAKGKSVTALYEGAIDAVTGAKANGLLVAITLAENGDHAGAKAKVAAYPGTGTKIEQAKAAVLAYVGAVEAPAAPAKPARQQFPTDKAGWGEAVKQLNAEHGSKMSPGAWGDFLHEIATGKMGVKEAKTGASHPGMLAAIDMAAAAHAKAQKPVSALSDDELLAELQPPAGATVEDANGVEMPAGVPKPAFNGAASKYWTKEADALEALAAKGDLKGLQNAHLKPGKGGATKYQVKADGTPKSPDAKAFKAYQDALVSQVLAEKGQADAAKVNAAVAEAVTLSKPIENPPQVGDGAKGKLPAPPNFEAAKLPASNTNADSHNTKVTAIMDAMTSGKANAILAMKFGTNTYAKKQVKLANDTLAAMGVSAQVTAGQKANSHPALTGGVTASEAMAVAQNEGLAVTPETFVPQAPKRIIPSLSDKHMPVTIDYMGANGGKGLSSKAWVNQQNAELQAKMVGMAKDGDYAGLKALTYPELSKDTGAPTGKMLPIDEHPAKGLQAFQDAALSAMDDILHPPEPLKEFNATTAASVDAITKAFPAKPLATALKSAKANEKLGYYVALGVAKPVEAILPKKTMPISSTAIGQASAEYQAMSPLAKKFISNIQSSGAMGGAYQSGAKEYGGTSLEALAKAAHQAAKVQPEGTTIYKWIDAGKLDTMMKAQVGTVMQSPSCMCASYAPTATKGFGNSLIEFVHAKGAKSLMTFGSGGYGGEKEVSILPNSRFVLLSAEKGGPHGAQRHVRLLVLPPDPALDK